MLMADWNKGINGVKFENVCWDCKPPKRSVHCHASCPDYLAAKAQHEAKVSADRAARKAANEAASVAFLLSKG